MIRALLEKVLSYHLPPRPDDDSESAETDSRHIIDVRSAEESINVLDIENIQWDDSKGEYKVRQEVAPINQNILTNPRIRAEFEIEKTASGTFLVQRTQDPEAAHAISVWMDRIQDGDLQG